MSCRRTPLVAALLCAGLLGAAPLYAATITVDSNADTTGNPAICTLRDAITAANTNVAVGGCIAGAAGIDGINFNIPGAGVHSIVLGSLLPAIDEPVVINGYTQPGSVANSLASAYLGAAIDAQPMVEIDGNGMGGNALFYVTQLASGTIITGLSVGNFFGSGAFMLFGTTGIFGNFIGVRADGTTAFPNKSDIQVLSTGQGSKIGSAAGPSLRNLIGGGIYLNAATDVTISDNLIGTDKSGTTVMGTALGGGSLRIGQTAGPNIVSNNVINYGSQKVGLWLTNASNTTISYNQLGFGVGGTTVGNALGIYIDNFDGVASNNVIKGNIIGNSMSSGIRVSDVTGLGGGERQPYRLQLDL